MAVEVLWPDGREGPAALAADGQRLLELVDADDAELAVTLCDDAHIRQLNARWRQVDASTDVLSFPQGDMPPGAPRALGDVVISEPTARRQASAHGHATEVELRVLLVHGLLHLLGHDHEEAEALRRMRAEEIRLLEALGLPGQGLVSRAGPPH